MKRSPFGIFLSISECVALLEQGMWGNVPRSVPVARAKKDAALGHELSVGFAPQRQESAALLLASALSGKLAIYIRTRDPTVAVNEPVAASLEMLKQVIPVRKGLPDRPVHVIGSAGDPIVMLLRAGELVIRHTDFEAWYKKEHARGVWPSQCKRQKRRLGRPSKDSEQLQNAIQAIVEDGTWNGMDGMVKLRNELSERGHEAPSLNTLALAVDRLFKRTGKAPFQRRARSKTAIGKR
jgi:hypothetical protein